VNSAHSARGILAPWFSVAALLLAAGARAEEGLPSPDSECRTSVRMEGDPSAVLAVGTALESRGVDTEPAWRCDALRVRVAVGEGKYQIAIALHGGALVERTAGTEEVAAALIESWARPDLEDPFSPREDLPIRVASSSPAPVFAEASSPPQPPVSAQKKTTVTPRGTKSPLGFDFETELVAASDGVGLGLHAAACVRLGAFCVGLAGRVGQMTVTSLPGVSRTGADVLAVSEMPIRFGSLSVTPSLGAGGGWLRTYSQPNTSVIKGVACAGSSGGSTGGTSGPGGNFTCTGSVAAPAPPDQNRFGPRLEGAVSIGGVVRDNWALVGRLSVSISPLAQTTPLVASPLNPSEAILPGEPLWLAQIGLGVEWASP
jgi:hypothetical protein